MNLDAGNQAMLQAGAQAYYQQHGGGGGSVSTVSAGPAADGWSPMSSAPRDGTIIEVRCTYGVAPWYGLYQWTETITLRSTVFTDDGKHQAEEMLTVKSPGWHKVDDQRSSFDEDSTFSWRPYHGSATTYVDPTGGAQNSGAYWRGAAAVKSGLPLDYFEREAAAHDPDLPWYQRLWNWLLL